MAADEPVTELDQQFSSPGANPTAWSDGRAALAKAEVYWLSTTRPDGRPHVTPMVAVWLDGALYFSTGAEERKATNLAANASCVITTGCNSLAEALDLVLEGRAAMITDEARLREVAAAYRTKYGPPFQFTVREGVFYGEGGEAHVYLVAPIKAFGYGRGEVFSATRWRF
jgi:nitroimidazol reductase NimA-like FMN-containing flavoprotein (pyridoxamine 5'-phosphate oxidase superfamily)